MSYVLMIYFILFHIILFRIILFRIIYFVLTVLCPHLRGRLPRAVTRDARQRQAARCNLLPLLSINNALSPCGRVKGSSVVTPPAGASLYWCGLGRGRAPGTGRDAEIPGGALGSWEISTAASTMNGDGRWR